MNLLIVEDFKEMRERIRDLIKETYPDVNVVAVESYSELRNRLFTQAFDAAIVDIDLSKWTDFKHKRDVVFDQENRITNGHDLAILIREFNNTTSASKVVLYTANDEKTRVNDSSFFVYEKQFDLDFANSLKKELLPKVIEFDEIKSSPSLNEFNAFTKSQKIKFYKDYLTTINSAIRFELLGDFAWTSNIINTQNKLCMGSALERDVNLPSQFEIAGYEELSGLMTKVSSIPNVFWNFRQPSYFYTQADNISGTRRLNSTLKLFYNLDFAVNLANFLIEIKEQASFDDYLSVLGDQDDFCKIETQNCLIRLMATNNDNSSTITSMIKKVSGKVGCEVVDLFDCTLVEYEERDAWVLLKSLIDPSRYFKRKFNYERLAMEGIRYKEEGFFYYVTRQNNGVSGFVEPN